MKETSFSVSTDVAAVDGVSSVVESSLYDQLRLTSLDVLTNLAVALYHTPDADEKSLHEAYLSVIRVLRDPKLDDDTKDNVYRAAVAMTEKVEKEAEEAKERARSVTRYKRTQCAKRALGAISLFTLAFALIKGMALVATSAFSVLVGLLAPNLFTQFVEVMKACRSRDGQDFSDQS